MISASGGPGNIMIQLILFPWIGFSHLLSYFSEKIELW